MTLSLASSFILFCFCFLSGVRFVSLFSLLSQLYLCILAPPFWDSYSSFIFTRASFSRTDVLAAVDWLSIWFVLFVFSIYLFKNILFSSFVPFSFPLEHSKLLLSISNQWHPFVLLSKRNLFFTLVLIFSTFSAILAFHNSGLRRIFNQFAIAGVSVTSIALLRNYQFGIISFLIFALQYQYTGFRYRLLLLVFPVMFIFLQNYSVFNPLKNIPKLFRFVIFFAFSLLGVILFSILTLVRVKGSDAGIFYNIINPFLFLSSMDIQSLIALSEKPFFADSNIIFAHTAVVFPRLSHSYSILGFLNDIFVEFIPSILYPGKPEPELHFLVRSQFGGGLSSLQASILFPICTPFILMFGKFLGIVISSLISAFIVFFSEYISVPPRIVRLPSIFTSYIQISVVFPLLYALIFRGFPPFVLKVFVWACIPSALLIRQTIYTYSSHVSRELSAKLHSS